MSEKISYWDIPEEIRNSVNKQLQFDFEPDNEILNEFRNIINNAKSNIALDDVLADFEEITEDKK
ncbi:MAG: hypothetical protein HDT21_05885 [Ruminococcus sp.]|nr:hypothetical protein [Ruminococcus sp.]